MNDTLSWLTLITSLPGQNASSRMRVWRALKAAGVATLRDGVYLLPRSPDTETFFREQAREIEGSGGTAHIAEYLPVDDGSHADLRNLFDRTEAYAAIFSSLDTFKKELAQGSEADARRTLATLRRDFAGVVEIDFFPGPSSAQVEQALADAEAAINARFSPDEPHAAAGRIEHCDKASFQKRTWVTRAHLWIDRVACAWLIRRFIDKQARFLWLKDVAKRPKNAIGFDFDGAGFTHVGTRISFEVLASSFGLDGDPAIARLGAMVHYLDVGGVPVPEAAGFTAIMAGARAQTRNDDELLAEIGKTLDYLYTAYSKPESD
ncbi:MAG: chromate resistance protein [Gammaproteobacteria bacterium]|nr:chromate resistance protein [Gammaproteobacteria bacterium]